MPALRDPNRFLVRFLAFVVLHALLISAALAVATYWGAGRMLTRKKSPFERVQLVAGRCGLGLVKSRQRVGTRRYFLRHIADVTRVVVVLPDGGFRFVKATRAGGKEKRATWLSLGAIEQILEGRTEPRRCCCGAHAAEWPMDFERPNFDSLSTRRQFFAARSPAQV
jgi:hypothetical protein